MNGKMFYFATVLAFSELLKEVLLVIRNLTAKIKEIINEQLEIICLNIQEKKIKIKNQKTSQLCSGGVSPFNFNIVLLKQKLGNSFVIRIEIEED
ncbi:CLUMA_CG006057, isoform A [Clunio marinus]|uniref:CLUMA_CG006057, isoform A n=1 Tax=Clunio marinus TaxID=568069 RepID=A0A1J1I0V5_9DIPT|nr:CLUMA_CG006057, isoform A [Clunio marinus]